MEIVARYEKEIQIPTTLPFSEGDQGPSIKRLQEWLVLHGYGVVIDGEFGPATAAALERCVNTNIVDENIWRALSAPLLDTADAVAMGNFGESVVHHAKNVILPKHPVEAGGDNKGPWVRHYCRGFEVAWCQGFVSTVFNDVARALEEDSPLDLVLEGIWCLYVPRMVIEAKAKGRFVSGLSSGIDITPGSMFYVRGGPAGHSHVGIVTSFNGTTFETVEGNTNDDGSANGYEVCRRIRRTSSCDFGVV